MQQCSFLLFTYVGPISEAKLSQIQPGIRAFIVVKIVRLWKTILPPHNEFISIDFLAIDDQKNVMHGTIPSEYSADFEDQLMEGNVYKINMFQVTKCKQSHNVVPLQKMLYLSSTTRIEQINDNLNKYPQHYFQFATMDDIIARTDREYFMTDVIGLLTSKTPISSIQISPKQVSANITGQSSAKNLTANKRDIFIKLLSLACPKPCIAFATAAIAGAIADHRLRLKVAAERMTCGNPVADLTGPSKETPVPLAPMPWRYSDHHSYGGIPSRGTAEA
ncbi:probable beta-d-xylosidase 6 [Phtheirospermum japonicum]|uniref:Probable beta-d-xylosidase 6 n=1 Tax=Phtheirospermum japonicum TaxID=374723 RepID=A0A830C0M5_9LAMI|nr:probable beta-d-xylosidase 6 [Phtheirospermum japonicum]